MVSAIEGLLEKYREHLQIPWSQRTSPAERVWFLVYPPLQERRIRAWLQEFETTTRQANYGWHHLDISNAFAEWMTTLEYRDAYFADPEDLEIALEAFGHHLVMQILQALETPHLGQTLLVLTGLASLFGFLKVSWLIEQVSPRIPNESRLLTFFPGTHENHNYRLLDARDGWDYLAIPIKN